MSKFHALFSSSKGNASFLGGAAGGILVDAGVSCRRLLAALSARSIPESAVQAICITHAHTDHIAGLRVFLKRHPVPVYATAQTLAAICGEMTLPESAALYAIEPGETATAADIAFTPFSTQHDAPGSCGYRFTMADGQTCAVCTDLGCVTPEVEQGVLGADLVLLEANYDPRMLQMGPYPYPVQARIRSDHGHLSNAASAAFAQTLVEQGTTRLVLGHLSETNNTLPLAERTVADYLDGQGLHRNRDFLLSVASPAGLEQAVIF